MDKVALCGFMGAGKTSVGRALAAALGCPFLDVDEAIEARHGAIAEQFVREGEATFRAREAAEVARWLGSAGPGVLALGGGAWQVPAVREALWGRAIVIHLEVPLAVARARVGGGAGRPLWTADVEARFEARQPSYREADLRIDASGPVLEVVQAIRRALAEAAVPAPERLSVAVDPRYDVWVAGGYAGLGDAARGAGLAVDEGVVLVSDTQVAPRWADAVAAELPVARRVVLPAGEAHKGWTALQTVVDGVLDGPVHRRTVVCALGGGVVGDVAGLGAALALRGVPVVQLPTSLLAMVDASVGGKTAINHPRGKNLVGVFHQPSLVWVASAVLGTLPVAERQAGWGEVAKTALVGDPELLHAIGPAEAAAAQGCFRPMQEAVARCVAVKARVVAEDAHERGIRVWLNAGHTVAHGLETALGHGTMSHGQAVALGLVAELRWAVGEGICDEPDLLGQLEAAVAGAGLSRTLPDYDRAVALDAMGHDKKGTAGSVRVPVPKRAGEMVVVDLPRARLHELLP